MAKLEHWARNIMTSETGWNTTSNLSGAEPSTSRLNLSSSGISQSTRLTGINAVIRSSIPCCSSNGWPASTASSRCPIARWKDLPQHYRRYYPECSQPFIRHSSEEFSKCRLFSLRLIKGNEDVVIAVDSTGIKVTNRGEWMRVMGRIHRGLLPQHVLGLLQKSQGKLVLKHSQRIVGQWAAWN